MSNDLIITAGAVASLILEGIKYLLRVYYYKNPEFDFSSKFYAVAIPVLSYLVQPLLAVLEVEGYSLPSDWSGWVKVAVQVLLSSLIAVGTYTVAIKPYKEYQKTVG